MKYWRPTDGKGPIVFWNMSAAATLSSGQRSSTASMNAIICLGARTYFVKDRTYDIQRGDLLFINKMDLHSTIERGGPGHERFLLNFNDRFLLPHTPSSAPYLFNGFLREYRLLRLKVQERLEVERILDKLAEESKRRLTGHEE